MKLHILSDLHIECFIDPHAYNLEDVGADVVVLAGDIGVGSDGVEWAGRQSERLKIPVVYVAGNHEYYYHDMAACKTLMQQAAAHKGVYWLDDALCEIGGVRFLGCTLWTDYSAVGAREQAMSAAAQTMPDHRYIEHNGQVLQPPHAALLHASSVEWLKTQLETPFAGKTVVVTHHAPTPSAQHPAFPLDALAGAFWTDLENTLLAKADLWIYGHTHACLDKVVAGTRVVSNQSGYRKSPTSPGEDPKFNPRFVVDI
ncbi:MAG: hypothetical protein GYB21_10955 [Oceanospirillales bacterium]|nr:hypothetical protein [Oceanospirillales bacterium]